VGNGRLIAVGAVLVCCVGACAQPVVDREQASTESTSLEPSASVDEPSSSAEASVLTDVFEDGSTVFVDATEQEVGPDALVTGELVSIDGQCVGLSDDSRQSVLIFEFGTSVGEGDTIVTPEGAVFALGDQIQGSGAYAELDSLAGDSDIVIALREQAPACLAMGTVASIRAVQDAP